MMEKNKLLESMIGKCSYCKEIFSKRTFESHECDTPINDVKIIEVAYFREDSQRGKKRITGRGLDGVLYTFEVVPRKLIPYVLPLSDERKHLSDSDGEVTVP